MRCILLQLTGRSAVFVGSCLCMDPEMRNSCNENSVEDAAGYTYKMRLHTSFSFLCHTNTFPTG